MTEAERSRKRGSEGERERDGMEVALLEIPAPQDRGGNGEKHQF